MGVDNITSSTSIHYEDDEDQDNDGQDIFISNNGGGGIELEIISPKNKTKKIKNEENGSHCVDENQHNKSKKNKSKKKKDKKKEKNGGGDKKGTSKKHKIINNLQISSSSSHQEEEEYDDNYEEGIILNTFKSSTILTSFEIDKQYLTTLFDIDKPYLKNLLKSEDGLKQLERLLKTDHQEGLSRDEELFDQFQERQRTFGRNVLPPLASKTIWYYFLESIKDHTLIMLLIAAVVSLLIGILWRHEDHGWIDSLSIIAAVVIVVTVTSLNNYSKEMQFQKLNKQRSNVTVKVVRGGQYMVIPTTEINVGEVIVVETGMIVPVDGILVQGFGISCEESSCTGESEEVKKDIDPSSGTMRMLSGSLVTEGCGRMMAICVGENSLNGKTMMSLRVDDEKTPLEERLDQLADTIGKVGIVIAAATFAILVLKNTVITMSDPDKSIRSFDFFNSIIDYLITAITIVVVVVPEGLPLAVTISLAYSMLKLFQGNNLVRKLEACETMGNATVICSDKTGTLTENRMTVVCGWIAGIKVEENINGIDYKTSLGNQSIASTTKDLIIHSIVLNSTAQMNSKFGSTNDHATSQFIGNQTECALLSFAMSLHALYDKQQPFSITQQRSLQPICTVIPFSSETKVMATIIKLSETQETQTFRIFIKGATEVLLNRCGRWHGSHNIINEMTRAKRTKLLQRVKAMSQDLLRTICIAYFDIFIANDNTSSIDQIWKLIYNDPQTYSNFICLAIFGIRDPIRKEVPQAIAIVQQAGMSVRMITGDNIDTAKNIATKLGILTTGGLCMEGSQFRELPPEEIDNVLPNLQVIARSTPLDKQLFVKYLKEKNEIVAVTGDGVNDAPSLKLAHVGFSMGLSGTEIAKEASDIILLDDNFASIINAIKWGRNVMESIKKFLQFQLTVNFVAVIISFVGSVSNSSGASPLSAVQLLWTNLIMDTLASLALATEEPKDTILYRKSKSVKQSSTSLISFTMWFNIIGQTIFQVFVLFGILYMGDIIFPDLEPYSNHHFTILFNTFIFLQIFNEFNCRRIHSRDRNVFEGILNNWQFTCIVLFCSIVQVILIQFGEHFIQTQPLNAYEWFISVGLGTLSLPLGLVIKTIRHSYSKFKRSKHGVHLEDIPTRSISFHHLVSPSSFKRPQFTKINDEESQLLNTTDTKINVNDSDSDDEGEDKHANSEDIKEKREIDMKKFDLDGKSSKKKSLPTTPQLQSTPKSLGKWNTLINKIRLQQRVIKLLSIPNNNNNLNNKNNNNNGDEDDDDDDDGIIKFIPVSYTYSSSSSPPRYQLVNNNIV